MSLLRLDMVSLLGLGVQEAQAKKTPAEAGVSLGENTHPIPQTVPVKEDFF